MEAKGYGWAIDIEGAEFYHRTHFYQVPIDDTDGNIPRAVCEAAYQVLRREQDG